MADDAFRTPFCSLTPSRTTMASTMAALVSLTPLTLVPSMAAARRYWPLIPALRRPWIGHGVDDDGSITTPSTQSITQQSNGRRSWARCGGNAPQSTQGMRGLAAVPHKWCSLPKELATARSSSTRTKVLHRERPSTRMTANAPPIYGWRRSLRWTDVTATDSLATPSSYVSVAVFVGLDEPKWSPVPRDMQVILFACP